MDVFGGVVMVTEKKFDGVARRALYSECLYCDVVWRECDWMHWFLLLVGFPCVAVSIISR